ncbi:MAG: Crp/Fnr family transcriptional regulator [Epsilonproteobacteria bacterium]|nr:Crp/Fnr family transcriptional regulator [Campylobacterota bacterium]
MELRKIPLFSELDDESLEQIRSISTLMPLKKSQIVFYQGDTPTYLYLLVKGVAKIYKIDTKGQEVVLHYFSAPTLLAERANLINIPYPANCIMNTDGMVLKIEFGKFQELMNKEAICLRIMQSLLKKMSSLEDVIDNIVLDTETKIAKFIYEHTEAFESLKQHSIASLLNIKPETLSRKLKKLKEMGVIQNQHSKLKVVDKEKLKDLFQW